MFRFPRLRSLLVCEFGFAESTFAMASQGWEICSTWEVDEGAGSSSLSDQVTVRDVHSSDGTGVVENACIRLVSGPEKQSCEVTVRFTQQQHAIHCIDVLSTARTCEVYRQNEGDTDAEYLCTARGQLETVEETLVAGEPVKSLYRAKMDLEDPDLCTSVTIRLLSLQDKSHVIIGHILVLVSPGPYLAGGSHSTPAPVQAAVGGASAASLGAMMPLMLQMAQGFSMPDLKNKMSLISNASAESSSEGIPSQQRGGMTHEELAMRALAIKPGPSPVEAQTPAPHPSRPAKSEASLEDVCQRLERLESVCARIETSLSKTLESFDKRLRILENGVGRPAET